VRLLRRLLRVRDLIDREYAQQLDVSLLAGRAYTSTAYFSRSFKRAFGETPHQYLLTRRMERAKALLRDTDLPVTTVSLAVGCSSLGSFSTTFRRLVGESPTGYRRRWRTGDRDTAAHRIPGCVLAVRTRPLNGQPRRR
jgi:AraC-like DNA-binding protein